MGQMDRNLLEQILNVSRRMAETRVLTPLLNYVLDEAIKLVGAERGYVVLAGNDGSLDFRVKRRRGGQPLEEEEEQISKSVLNQVIETSQPLIIEDAIRDPHFGQAESVILLGLRSIMCVPLISRGDTIGAVYVENRSIRNRFSEVDLPPLVLFANQAAVAIENAALNDDLEARVAARTKELKEAMQQVEQSWTEAVEANRLRTVWLSKVAHDLRAPLGIISTSLSLLEEGGLGELNDLQLEWIKKSLKMALHLSDLTNDLFDLSRLEAGGLTLQRDMVSLSDFLQNVYKVSLGLPWPETVKFILDAPEQLPDVFIDPTRIHQVLLNLISNAHKFTAEGSVTLHACHLSGQDMVRLGVADTGEGIPADKLDHLFQRFQQVDGNSLRRRLGSGLGLAICRELVEMHGGRIWVESTPGLGSNFMFTLPLNSPLFASQTSSSTL